METADRTFNWGIIGSGHIAGKLVKSSWSVKGCKVIAAASRTEGKADSFCREFEIERPYGSYRELLDDPDVEIVYVANTHNFHFESVIQALEAGKHVLCEKPLAVNASQVSEMIRVASESQRFLMEAMWTRFLPAIVQVRQWLDGNAIGRIRQIHASFGINLLHVKRLTDPMLAGGALLDIGIYPLSFSSMVMQGSKPYSKSSHVEMLDTGVDGSSIIILQYADGAWADLKCSCVYRLPNDAWIIGESGRIHIPADFYSSQHATLLTDNGEITKSFPSEKAQSFKFQMTEVQDCISRGLMESPAMPLRESLALAEAMDDLRMDWGVEYPGE